MRGGVRHGARAVRAATGPRRGCGPAVGDRRRARRQGRGRTPAPEGRRAARGGAPVAERGRSLWGHRDFMRLWAAETISQIGSQVTLLALPLAAILILDASAFEVGALSSIEVAPFLLVGLPAGVWVDRLRRRPILIAGDIGRAIALASIPIAYWLDALTLTHLY